MVYISLLKGRPLDVSVCGCAPSTSRHSRHATESRHRRYTLLNPPWVNFLSLACAFACSSTCISTTHLLCQALRHTPLPHHPIAQLAALRQGEPFLHRLLLQSTATISAISLCGAMLPLPDCPSTLQPGDAIADWVRCVCVDTQGYS